MWLFWGAVFLAVFVAAPGGAALSIRKWNSRLITILAGTILPPIIVFFGGWLQSLSYSESDLQGGGGFALGMMILVMMIVAALAGFVISLIIGFSFKERVGYY